MKKAITGIAVMIIFLTAAAAFGFDCRRPPFGRNIDDLEIKGLLTKYKENNGIDYYEYSGACPELDRLKTSDSYKFVFAFVNGKLYARIMELYGLYALTINDTLESSFIELGPPDKISQEGDWDIFQWRFEKTKTKGKVKINLAEKTAKSSMYYEPLRRILKNETGFGGLDE